MSDDDSDWGSDDGGVTPAPLAVAPSLAPPPVPKPAAPPKPLPSSLIEPDSQTLPSQQAFLTVPVQFTTSLGKVQIAGATVLYTVTDTSWKIYFYDAENKPLFIQLIPSDCVKGRKGFSAPCMFELQEGGLATMIDEVKRGSKAQFQDRQTALRMLIFICIGQAATRAQQNLPPYSLVDIAKGVDKPCKPKHTVEAVIRGWRVQMNANEPNLTQPLPPHLANFNPTFADSSSIFNANVHIVVEDPPDAELPARLGQVVGRMCAEGQRLLVCPASSALSKALLADHMSEPSHRAVASKEGYFLVLFVQVTSVGKAKKEKEKKVKKDKEKKVPRIVYKEEAETKAEETKKEVILPPMPKPEEARRRSLPLQEPDHPPVREELHPPPAAVAKPARAPLFPMQDDDLFGSSTTATPKDNLLDLEESMKALSVTQSKIVKTLITKAFEAIVRDLALAPSIEDDEASAARKVATKNTVKQHIVSISTLYEQANSAPNPGTLRSVTTAFQQMDKGKQDKEVAKANSKQVVELQAQVKRLEAEKKAQEDKAGAAQLKLATDYLALEEKVAKLRKDNEELNKKCQMTEVFEQGMKDMRKILGDETAEKNKLQLELNDLLQLQKGLKMTWLPDKYATNCMQCKEKFKSFGSKSKGHCRYCGRLFCQDCCTVSEIPEYGFREKVKICVPCHTFRRKLASEAGGGGSDDKD